MHSCSTIVTGAGGFIGSHLLERLVSSGSQVRAFVHYNSMSRWGNLDLLDKDVLDNIEIFQGDIKDPFAVDRAVEGCRVVFHLASLIAIPYSYIAPESFVSTNVLGAVNVLEACRRHNVEKIIHTSTSECYGTARTVPMNEQHPLQSQSPYSASKNGADMMAESYYRSFGVPVSIVRPFNTYGPRQSARAIIPTIVTQVVTGSRLRLGNLSPTRDLTYVSDTVDGFIRAAETDACVGQVVNIGNGREISMGDLARKIMNLMGREIEISQEDERTRPPLSEVDRLVCDNSKARDLMGWQPKVGLDEGLLRTIEWVQANLSQFKAGIYNT